MASDKKPVLALGATGLAGICLLRELISSQRRVVVYARNPDKIPHDLASNELLTIIKGEISNQPALEKAMTPCTAVLSLLGPSLDNKNIDPSLFANYYKDIIFPTMRKLGIRRIIAMGTISISRPDDRFSAFQLMVRVFMRLFASTIYANMHNLATAFEVDGLGLDWTVFRIAALLGESDENSWRRDRAVGSIYAGVLGGSGWTTSITRALLARWIVGHIEDREWYGAMPALSTLSV